MENSINDIIDKPVFLVGAERSGTTLLRLMLHGHPDIVWLSEFEYSVDFISSNTAWPESADYVRWLLTNRVFQLTGLSVHSGMTYPQMIRDFFRQTWKKEALIVGATCHRHYDRLLRLYPDAKFIYLYRDPRDVARSNIGMGWAGNAWYGVDRWIEAEKLWEKIKLQIPKGRYIEVKYESVIKDPTAQLKIICDFLGRPYDEKMLRYPEYTTYSLPDKRLINQWKKKMSAEQITLVEAKAGPIMDKRQYYRVIDDVKPPSMMEKIFLYLDNKAKRVRRRFRRFGIILVFSDFLSRRLGLDRLQQRIRLRMNEIENGFIK